MNASQILHTAADIVGGERQGLNGPGREDFREIAAMWTADLTIRRDPTAALNGEDVAHMMSLLKKARSQCGVYNADDHLDDCGYAAIAGEVAAWRFE